MQVLYKWFFTVLLLTLSQKANASDVMHPYEQPIPMPNISWQDTKGNVQNFESLSGKVVLLNLWATWCTPCAIEMPSFNFLQKRYGAGGFIVLPIAVQDTPENVEKFIREKKLTYIHPQIDLNDMVGKTFLPKTMPTTYLINRKGQIIAGKEGLSEWLSEDMFSLIEDELRKNQKEFKPNNIQVIDRTHELSSGVRF